MLVVVRPGMGGFQSAARFGASSFCWALALIITRKIASPTHHTVLWSAAIGTVVLTLRLPFQAVWPNAKQLGLAYRIVPSSLLAALFYGQLLWVTVLGLLVFGTLPNMWTVAGAGIIIASGLTPRERVRPRRTGARVPDDVAKPLPVV
jgi:drug/metabolite transporter (DMT)-like permease